MANDITVVWQSYKTGKQVNISQYVVRAEWQGADTQASRTLTVSVVNGPNDPNIKTPKISNGDKLFLYNGGSLHFLGKVFTSEAKSEAGSIDFTAYDYLHRLIKSQGSYKFKNRTAEYITRAICRDVGLKVGSLAKTNVRLKKYYPSDMTFYDIIQYAYNKATKTTGKKYIMRMNGSRLDVVERGTLVKDFVLADDTAIYESTEQLNADNVVNKVAVYDSNNKLIGTSTRASSIEKYGTIQAQVQVDKVTKKNKKKILKNARGQLKNASRSATISALGSWRCIAGRSVRIADSATGLIGRYWIKSDRHTWENGVHKMELDLRFSNVLENVSYSKYQKSKSKKDGHYTTKYTIENGRKVKALFTAYYPHNDKMEGGMYDAQGHKLVPKKLTCAAPKSIAFGWYVMPVKVSGGISGKPYRVNDRGGAIKIVNGVYHFDILMPSKSACEKFGRRKGYAVIGPSKKKKRTWVASDDGDTGSASDNKTIEKLIKYAFTFRGKVRYVYGACSPQSGVSDCSGFTQYVFRHVGKSIGRSTESQEFKGSKVTRSELKRGDLVIFKNTYASGHANGASHVGIMVSHNKFIHCSSSGKKSKTAIKVSSLNNSYYRKHFLWGRRIIK